MKQANLLLVIICLISNAVLFSQTADIAPGRQSEKSHKLCTQMKGLVLDKKNKSPLPYTNIYVLHKGCGVISNEKGNFAIDVSELQPEDTLRFQYVGYKSRDIIINQLDSLAVIYLEEELFNLSETLVFGTPPDPEVIVEKVLLYKDSNYIKLNCRQKVFIREREINTINQLKLKYKKSSVSMIDRAMIAKAEKSIPRQSTYYKDFLGNLYQSKNKTDSLKFKLEPIKVVALQEDGENEMAQIEGTLEDAFINLEADEYWKLKSGIFSFKVDEGSETDSTTTPKDTALTSAERKAQIDSIEANNERLKYFRNTMEYRFNYADLYGSYSWDFLYNPGRYNFLLESGTRINGEDVYIISFTPKLLGEFKGRLYISTNTFALIRADYEYAEQKDGTDIHIAGVGYTENLFVGSIYFEKKGEHYRLKYFSIKRGALTSFDRNVAMIKKRKRRFFDKKLEEIKIGLDLGMSNETLLEVLVLEDVEISHGAFAKVIQNDHMDVIYVDQFNADLWKGYTIIEPTTQMKEYKKSTID